MELNSSLSSLNTCLTTNNTTFYFDNKNGKYGFNTDPNRGADTFFPFSNGKLSILACKRCSQNNTITAFTATKKYNKIYAHMTDSRTNATYIYVNDEKITFSVVDNYSPVDSNNGNQDALVVLNKEININDVIKFRAEGGGGAGIVFFECI